MCAKISRVPDFIVLIPVLLLPLGAMIIALIAEKISERSRRRLLIALLTLEIVAILLNIAPSSHRIELSTWDLASFSITFQLDGTSLILLLAIFIPIVALQLAAPRSFDAFTFYVLASALALICAGNLLTALFAWTFLDFTLFAWREARGIPHEIAMRALVLGQLAGLVFFAGTILLGTQQNETGAALIALAFWARLGLFPFLWIFPNVDLQTLELASVRGASIVAGASLWLHWDGVKATAPSGLIAWLAGIAFVAALVWIARESEAVEKIAVCVSAASLAAPLAIAFGGDALVSSGQSAAPAFALWIVLGIAFALAMFELGVVWQSDHQTRWPRLYFIAGIFSLAGLPLTPAFLGRVGTYVAMAGNGQAILLLIAVLAMTFALSPLWRIGLALGGSEPREPTGTEHAGMQLLGLTFVVISLAPTVIASAAGQAMSDSANQALNTVIHTNDVIGVSVGFVALVTPIVISFLIARVNWGYHSQWDELTQFAARVIDLDWLARLITAVGRNMSAAAGNLSALAEENPTVWILLVGLWIAIFILTSR